MAQKFDLSGKTALITGASSGLGWQFAHTMSQAGARVIITARRNEQLERLKHEIASKGGEVISYVLDVSNSAQIYDAVTCLEEQGEHLDIVVNNAGIAKRTPIFSGDHDDNFESNIQTNLTGLWHMTKATANHMKNHGIAGSIINIASVSGENSPSAQATGYCASKAGVIQLTKTLVGELSPYKIRINSISPGWIHTPMTDKYEASVMAAQNPLNFVGMPTDLDGVLLLLACNEASQYITGVTISVDGGISWGG